MKLSVIKKLVSKIVADHYYFIRVVNAIVISKNALPNIKAKDRKLVRFCEWIYFAIIAFVVMFTILVIIYPRVNWSDNFKTAAAAIEFFSFSILLFDYFLWIWTAPARNSGKKSHPRIRFFFSTTSFFLVMSLITSVYIFNALLQTENQVLKFFGSYKFIRILRLILALAIFKPFDTLFKTFQQQRKILISVFGLIILMVLIFALLILNAEVNYINDNGLDKNGTDLSNYADTFLKALYFTGITLTTIGYGDIVPHSDIARSLVVVMSFLGVAVFAIPSGVIAAGFLSEIQNRKLQAQVNEQKVDSSKLNEQKKLTKDFLSEMKNLKALIKRNQAKSERKKALSQVQLPINKPSDDGNWTSTVDAEPKTASDSDVTINKDLS